MRKFLVLAVVACMLVAGFVSCNSDAGSSVVGDGNLVKVVFFPVIPQEKTMLSSTVDMKAAAFEFQAEPASKSTNMKGATAPGEWETLSAVSGSDNTYQTGARFTVGQWVFKVRAFNENGGLLYEGNSETVLLTSGSNNVTVGLAEKINTAEDAKGTVSFDISTPRLIAGGNPGTMTITFKNASTDAAVTATLKAAIAGTLPEGKQDYQFTAKYELPAGMYVATVTYSETLGAGESAQTVSMSNTVVGFRIVEKTDTAVKGNIQESLYASAAITMQTPKTVKGTLAYTGPDSEGAYTCTFTSNSATNTSDYLQPTAFNWYVDGVKQTSEITGSGSCNTSVFKYKPGTSYGNHSITCVAIYTDSVSSSVCSQSVSIEVKN